MSEIKYVNQWTGVYIIGTSVVKELIEQYKKLSQD